MIDKQAIGRRWDADGSKRDERGRRLFAASETRAAGWGGLVAVSEISGLARSTIERGLKDLDGPALSAGRMRRDGGGPRPLTKRDPTLLDDLRRLVEPVTLGDPVRPLLWVSKSLDKLAASLTGMGHSISPYGQIICPTDAPSRHLTMIVAQEPAQSLAALHRPLAAAVRVPRKQQDVALALVVRSVWK